MERPGRLEIAEKGLTGRAGNAFGPARRLREIGLRPPPFVLRRSMAAGLQIKPGLLQLAPLRFGQAAIGIERGVELGPDLRQPLAFPAFGIERVIAAPLCNRQELPADVVPSGEDMAERAIAPVGLRVAEVRRQPLAPVGGKEEQVDPAVVAGAQDRQPAALAPDVFDFPVDFASPPVAAGRRRARAGQHSRACRRHCQPPPHRRLRQYAPGMAGKSAQTRV